MGMTDIQIEEELVGAGPSESQTEEQEDREANPISDHARQRMGERGISNEAVFQVIAFGRIARGRGATIYAIGKKEVTEVAKHGINLSFCEGMHVVMNRSGIVLTVYRNLSMPKVKPRRKMPERVFRQNRRRELARTSFAMMAYA